MGDVLEEAAAQALREARGRREELRAQLARLEDALARPAAGREAEWRHDVLAAAAALQEAFDGHVEVTEEPGGLYDEIIAHAPRLAHSIEVLKHEHVEITEEIATLLASAAEDAEQLRERGVAVMGAVVRHRHKGADLVYEAFNTDIGAGD